MQFEKIVCGLLQEAFWSEGECLTFHLHWRLEYQTGLDFGWSNDKISLDRLFKNLNKGLEFKWSVQSQD